MDKLNPRTEFAYYMIVVFITMFTMDIVILLTSLSGAIINYILLKKNKFGFGYTIVLFVIIAVINPIMNHRGEHILFFVNDIAITRESVIYGILMATMVVSVLYWFRNLTISYTSDKLLYLFGMFSPKIALMLSMIFRFIPQFKNQAKMIDEAQRASGRYRSESLPENIRVKVRVFSILTTWALENGITTADSMEARNYGKCKRTTFNIYRFGRKDLFMLILMILLGVLTIYRIYAAFVLLAYIPLFIRLEEYVKWKYLMSEI